MEHALSFSPASLTAATSASSTVALTEVDVLTITDPKFLRKSLLTIHIDAALGGLTTMQFRYFVADARTSAGVLIFHQIPIKDASNGKLLDRPSEIDANSPIQGSDIRVAEDVPLGASVGFKISVQGTGAGSGTLNSLRVWARDN